MGYMTIFGDVSHKPKLYRFMCFDLKNTYLLSTWHNVARERDTMSITRVYRDRDNNIKVEKFSFEEVKKDLTKFFSHDNRISNRKDKNEIKRFNSTIKKI